MLSHLVTYLGTSWYNTPCYCQTPVQVLGLGVDFVLPLSQQEQEQQEQQEEPHQNRPLPGMLGR